ALLIEALEIDRGALRELLELPLSQPLPAHALDCRVRVLVGAARSLNSTQPSQPMGMLLDGQVQRAVGRTEIAVRLGAIRDPADMHLTEHRAQRPAASAFHA